jgi:hypothetical protein
MTDTWIPSFEGSTTEIIFGPLDGNTLDRLDDLVEKLRPARGDAIESARDAVDALREAVESALVNGRLEDLTMLRTDRTREINSYTNGYALFEQPGQWELHAALSADPQVRMVHVREAPSAW